MLRLVSPFIAATFILVMSPSPVAAQADSVAHACEGMTVGRIDVRAQRPPFSGAAARWRGVAHAIGLHHATTREQVIRAFLALHVGRPCTEFRRAESERVLRAQPFLSDATVRVDADTGGTVAVVVTTTDEIPVLVNARFRGIVPEAFALGNENVGGLGLHVEGRIENGGEYRNAIGARIEQSALFGRPYNLVFEAERYRVGERIRGEVGHPFFTDLQRISWHAAFDVGDDYPRFERPARDPLALQSTMRSWNASGILRVFGTGTVALLGGGIGGRQFEPADRGVVITDSGVVADSGIALRNRYQEFRVGRIGVIGGIRKVTFKTVSGFDALTGPQDVAHGAMIAMYAGHGLPQFGDEDLLLSTAFYAGAANANALLATVVQAEARRASDGAWDSAIGSGRAAFYWGRGPGMVLVLDDRISASHKSRLPVQLSFRDREAGLAGYRSSAMAGAVRNVASAEVRWSAASLVRKADLGVAAFGRVGTLWTGDVPYGVNVTRATVGIGLLGAYPTKSKRLYRADLVVPLTRSGTGAGKIEVRFTSGNWTHAFWTEPMDVTNARTGTEPARLFAWPSR
jgi:hypothetical protein